MMRPTLVRVLAIKKKSCEKKTIRDDYFNDMIRYLKENYSLWLSAKPKLKLIKVIDVSRRPAGLFCCFIAPLQGGIQFPLHGLWRVTVDQFPNQIKAVPCKLTVILAHGIHRDRERVVKIVIVKAG